MSSQGFILYSFIKLSKNESLRSLLVIFVEWLPWKPQPFENFYFNFWLIFSSCITHHAPESKQNSSAIPRAKIDYIETPYIL